MGPRRTTNLAFLIALAVVMTACSKDDHPSTPDLDDAGLDSGVDPTSTDSDAGLDSGVDPTPTGSDAGLDSGVDPTPTDSDAGLDASIHDASAEATPASVLRASISLALLNEDGPSKDSSFGEVTSEDPYGGSGTSLRYVKTASSPKDEKFELHLPFTFAVNVTFPLFWDPAREHLGAFTIADIDSIRVSTRRNDETTEDFTMLVYTTPIDDSDDPNDSTWYHHRLHAELSNADMLNAPARTWNTFSTSAGTNQIRFWDYRNADVNAGEQPNDNYFTLANMQDGPVAPTGLDGRDYRDETVKFLTFSTYSNYTSFDGSIDGIEIRLKDGQVLILDFTD